MRRQFSGRRRFGPGLSPAVTWILATVVASFLILVFMGKANQAVATHWGVLTGDSLARGHVWKIATTALFNAPLALLLHGLMLVMFIPILEHQWGTKRFLRFFVLTLLVGNALGGLVGMLVSPHTEIIGIGPFVLASIVAYGVMYANQPVQFFGVVPIKAKVLAIGIAAITLLFTLIERRWAQGAADFGAMGLAYAMMSGIWTPNVWWLKFRRWRIRRRYQVLDGGASPKAKKQQQWLN